MNNKTKRRIRKIKVKKVHAMSAKSAFNKTREKNFSPFTWTRYQIRGGRKGVYLYKVKGYYYVER